MSKAAVVQDKYQRAVTEIRSLMANWFESGVDLFLKLREVDQTGVWKQPGHATFADFLRTEFPTALGIERYQNVINAIDVYGVERVKQVGIDSCHALTVKALVESPEKRTQVLAGIDRFVQTNGCAPDRNKVRELVASVAPETRRLPKELRTPKEIELEEKLREAKAEVTTLRKRVRELEGQLAKVSKAGGDGKETTKARTRGGSAKRAA